MKKIGILTYHRAINYGAFLQCYSLSTYVQTLLPEYKVEVIDYETVDEYIVTIKGLLKASNPKELWAKIKRYRLFRKDLKKYLPLSKKRSVSNKREALSVTFSNDYDAIIVGSDAVWNGVDDAKYNFYLFNVNTKKYSYAASTSGLKLENVAIEKKKELKALIESFLYIGVREEKSENILKKLNISKPFFHNCDPTCFIDLNNIDIHIDKKLHELGIAVSKPVVCLMTDNTTVGRFVRERFGSTHQIVALYVKNKYADFTLYDLSPMEFAVFFNHINILFSRFFHGCYLCLKNGIPVIATDEIVEPDHEMSKMQYLFKRLRLDDWYYNMHELKEGDWLSMMNKAQTLMDKDQHYIIFKRLNEECQFRDSFTEAIVKELR